MTSVAAALPDVRLEVRLGSGRHAAYSLADVDFLIGAVAGCDLRVPGTELPPVVCLISRHPDGVYLRKLAPTPLLLVNGQTAANAALADGDRITLGAVDIYVRVQASDNPPVEIASSPDKARLDLQKQIQTLRAQVVRFHEERDAFAQSRQQFQDELQEKQRQLEDQVAELEREKTYWYQRRAELQKEIDASGASEPTAPGADVQQQLAEIEQERQELAAQRQELADVRKQHYERYQERRDRLAGLKDAVDKAAQKVQEQKRQNEADAQEWARQRRQQQEQQTEIDNRTQLLAAESARLEQERRRLTESQTEVQGDVAAKLADLQAREEKLAVATTALQTQLKQYESDVLRLDRRQGELEQREREVQTKLAELDEQLQHLRDDGAELEAQAAQLDEMRAQVTAEKDRLDQQKSEQDAAAAQLAQRSALLEGQQATLAALRTRLERIRDDVRRQEQQLEEQRSRQETVEAELEREAQALLQLKTELENEEKLREQERRQLTERGATLENAVKNLHQVREELAREEERLRQRGVEFEQRQAALAEQEGVLQGRLNHLAEAQQRLDAERQALRERTLTQTQAEQAREALQEQLRRRAEELAGRQKALNEQIQEYQSKTAALEEQRGELEQRHRDAGAEVEAKRLALQQEEATLQAKRDELHEWEVKNQGQQRQLQEMGRTVAEQQQALAQQQDDNQRALQEKLELQAKARAEFEALLQDAKRVVQLLPDAELRAGTALDRVSHAREQLRDHVGEIHAYVRQCQDDLEGVRAKLQADVQKLAGDEQTLRRGQEEHRLALVAFRQQLIDWQGQMSEIKRQLARGETKLERRQAEMDAQVRGLDVAAQRLAQQADALGRQQSEVAAERDALDRQLVDLRQWYRQKLRELAGIPEAAAASADGADSSVEKSVAASTSKEGHETTPILEADAIVPTSRDILSITEPMDSGDRTLGETLRGLQLIDAEALSALLMEARRQRRSLRQVLLTSGVVTLYQLALIEAGNVDGLMLGPVRVVDRLRATPQELVYRVFDPRHGREAVLRQIAEDATPEACAAFRERCRQAMVEAAHVATTYEVLEIAGRPAALQEWLIGLPASDWPPLAAAPGVCFRLLTQAALGLATIHKAGVTHGHFDDGALLLTGEGLVKICGLAESWTALDAPAEPRDDLRRLGQLAADWCLPRGVRKGAKTKPLPDVLQALIQRLSDGGVESATELLDELDRIGADVSPNAEAWDRLLKYVREHETPEALLRQSA